MLDLKTLEACGKGLQNKRAIRRFQSVWFALKHQKSVDDIAELLGLHKRTVYKHLERYAQQGLAAFEAEKPGPRVARTFTPEQESQLLESLAQQAQAGEVLTAQPLKEACEALAGRRLGRMTIYRILHRNGWSKKRPRPRHPKADREAQEGFKKTEATDSRDC